MKIIRRFFCFALAAYSSIANAGTNESITNVKITMINAYGDFVMVRFPAFANTQNCSQTNQDRAIIRFNGDIGKAMYSAALSAASSKLSVNLAINGCDASTGLPLIYRVDVIY